MNQAPYIINKWLAHQHGSLWKIPFLVSLCLLLNFSLSSAESSQENKDNSAATIHYHDNRLFIEANHIPLASLLKKIAQATNINIHLKGPAEIPITFAPAQRTIEQAMRKLGPGINVAFKYRSANTSNRVPVLTDIYIVSGQGDNALTDFYANHNETVSEAESQKELFDTLVQLEPNQLVSESDINRLGNILRFSPNPESRIAAAELLANVSTDQMERAASSLTLALNDDNKRVKSAVLVALTVVSSEKAHESMMTVLKDNDPEMRIEAIRSMGLAGARDGMAILDQGLKDPDAGVRAASVAALGRMEDEAAINWLMAAARDEDASVREAAVFAMAQFDENKRQMMPEDVAEREEIQTADDEVVQSNPDIQNDTSMINDGEPAMPGLPGFPETPPDNGGIPAGGPGSETGGQGNEGSSDGGAS